MRSHLVCCAFVLLTGTLQTAALQQRLDRVRTDLLSRTGPVEAAVRELKAILAVDPQSAEAHMLLGIAYRMQGSPEMLGEAKAELVQAIANNPQFAPARYYLAQLYLELGRPGGAREQMEAALTQHPGNPQFLALLGEAERQLGKPDRALALNREALKSDESFAQARYYAALALNDLKRRAEAIAELERVVAAKPDVADPYLALGTAYLDAGRLEPALSVLAQGAAIDGARADIHLQLARGYRLKKVFAKAEEQLALAKPAGVATQASLASQQVEADFEVERGLLNMARGRYDAAIEAFRKVLDLDPNHGPTNRDLAQVYLLQGRVKEASEYAARAEKLGFPLPRKSPEKK
jgi:tetratricopeptide (TPR) repeat protein